MSVLRLYLRLEAPLAFFPVKVVYEKLVRGCGDNKVLVFVDAHSDQTVAAAREFVQRPVSDLVKKADISLGVCDGTFARGSNEHVLVVLRLHLRL